MGKAINSLIKSNSLVVVRGKKISEQGKTSRRIVVQSYGGVLKTVICLYQIYVNICDMTHFGCF